MMGFISFIQKRPSDLTIRASRIIFGLVLIISLYYNLIYQGDEIKTTFLFMNIENNVDIVKYILIALGVIPIFMGIFKICILKKKYMRIIQIIFGIFLFYISSIIVEGPSLDIDSLIAFMGFLPLIAGITGKCIPSYCMKYAEKITKIRV
ncbi:hypothetical protein LRZ95_01585 [Candidatus Gracilibacteria bacterium]|nr:hypothetical protein [Candidatus Gracilibacteria bacterium]